MTKSLTEIETPNQSPCSTNQIKKLIKSLTWTEAPNWSLSSPNRTKKSTKSLTRTEQLAVVHIEKVCQNENMSEKHEEKQKYHKST